MLLLELIVYFSKDSVEWVIDISEDEISALVEVVVQRDSLAQVSKPAEGHTSEDILCLALSVFTTMSGSERGTGLLASLSKGTCNRADLSTQSNRVW
jgi:hypothetical protein